MLFCDKRFSIVSWCWHTLGEASPVFSTTAYTCNESAVCGCADFWLFFRLISKVLCELGKRLEELMYLGGTFIFICEISAPADNIKEGGGRWPKIWWADPGPAENTFLFKTWKILLTAEYICVFRPLPRKYNWSSYRVTYYSKEI